MRIAIPLAAAFVALASPVGAQGAHDHHGMAHDAQAPSANPKAAAFAEATGKAMVRMHAGMADAPTTSDPRHDFLSQMIPHHQGAIDMAKAVLLTTEDLEIRNLAQSIIVEQHYEIDLMKRLLAADKTTEAQKSKDSK